MTATLNFDIQTDEQRTNFQQLLNIARQLKLSFKIHPESENELWKGVFDWSDVDDATFSKFAVTQVVEDWECPEEWATAN